MCLNSFIYFHIGQILFLLYAKKEPLSRKHKEEICRFKVIKFPAYFPHFDKICAGYLL